MRVSVLGPGAVGCFLGVLARNAGHTVEFISRRESRHGSAGRAVRLVLPGGWHVAAGAPWFAEPRLENAADLVLVCLGRQHTRQLKKGALAALAAERAGGVVLCNCDPEEADRLGIPAEARSLCATLMSVVMMQERDVELANEAPVLVVESGSPVERLLRDLVPFGVKLLSVKDVVPYVNSLFVYQLLFLPVALCNSTMGHFLSFPEGRELAGLLLEEGLRTMERAGRRTARLPLLDPRELLTAGKARDGRQSRRYAPDRSYPPTLTAFLRGRPTESRELNKRIVEMAGEEGVELTWNWRLYQKAGRAASVGFYRDPAELLRSLT